MTYVETHRNKACGKKPTFIDFHVLIEITGLWMMTTSFGDIMTSLHYLCLLLKVPFPFTN